MSDSFPFTPACPIPIQQYPTVQMAHGGGGRLMHQLVEQMFLKAFGPAPGIAPHDSAVLPFPSGRLAFTTDSYVVRPLFFPGGDIGTMAVYGTVNDLAMSGARPLYLSAGFILEEGLPMSELWRVVNSMRQAAARCNVRIVTGDTKVVDQGKGDGVFINTSGIGVVEHALTIAPEMVRPGDVVLVSGDLGRHGMTILSVREGLGFEARIASDCAPVAAPILELLAAGVNLHCLRDLTRGGLASALNEIAQAARQRIHITEAIIPVRDEVRAACELLGLDPLLVANEGRFVAFVPEADAARALAILNHHAVDTSAARIGSVVEAQPPLVVLQTPLGPSRILDLPSGEQLPRIC